MTTFVESCVETAADSAKAAQRHVRGRPRVKRLITALQDAKKILVTCHQHPDPDAIGSCAAMTALLRACLNKDTVIDISIKGQVPGGVNSAFARHAGLKFRHWDDAQLAEYDAIILLDVQPSFSFSPLPEGVEPTAVIDHHRTRRKKPKAKFVDIRTEVGACGSIVFSYFMEMDVDIPPDIAAVLLYAIESDLAGAAGAPSQLDNLALSSLTLVADTKKLYQMRHVVLPREYFVSHANALATAMFFENALIAHAEAISSLEQPAVIADFLLRFDQVQYALVTATHGDRMVLSLRSSVSGKSAGEIMRRLVRAIGEGGGHKMKAGGNIELNLGTPAEIERIRRTVKRRLLKTLEIEDTRGQKLLAVQPLAESIPVRFATPKGRGAIGTVAAIPSSPIAPPPAEPAKTDGQVK